MKTTLTFSFILLFIGANAQVNIDKSIQLTGSGSNAKISGIQDVSSAEDATSAERIQKGTLLYAAAGGSANSISVTLAPPVNAYTTGMIVNFKVSLPNSGPVTINVNGLGAVALKKAVITDLVAGDLIADQMASVIYDGTNFQMISAANASGGGCSVPAQPGAITGPPAVVPFATNLTFSVTSYTGVFAYEWTVPAGATIVSGQGYNSITVNFGNTSGSVTVTGNNHCGASPASSFAVSVNQPKVIFVTNSSYDSNQSPAQRDAACQYEAGLANLSGTFKAWVSNGGSNNVPSTSGYLYQRSDGALIAYDWNDLVDGTIASPINLTAGFITYNDTVFTGLSASGLVTANTCSDWTSTSNSVTGTFGLTMTMNSSWTNSGSWACATPPTPTFLGWVGDPNYYPSLTVCQNCYGGTYLNGTQFGNFSNVPYTVSCTIIPQWNSVTCARCNKDVITQKQYRHYCVEQ
ncbi:MAG: hypothetical protein IT223_12115 [Crocinitomicaceae bacterium]|nr:hypothetical protein [Crocinitomicaceae bacterium]